MRNLMLYMLQYYVRSYRYVSVLVVFIICTALIYSYKPISLGSNYSLTCTLMFLVSAWLAAGFIEVEAITQQQLTILYAKSENRYYMAKILLVWLLSFILSSIIIVYPVIFDFFVRPISGPELVGVFLAHGATGLLGIAVAVLFEARLISNRRTAILALVALLTVSAAGIILIKEYPFATYLSWILPPVSLMAEELMSLDLDEPTSYFSFVVAMGYSVLYSGILLVLYVKLMKRKLF
ncbi:MAG: hypothetical protein H6Q73_1906 [Firmicutes bacterium]|nr:hypothetical protein [Bacillota bacterium]